VTVPVAIDSRARRAWPFLRGIALAHPRTIVIGPDGTMVVLREDGTADQVLPGGHPRGGAAFDPCNARRRAA
jgi:hypothetical protein